MDSVYVKAALYMYGNIPGRVKEIDNIIYRKALASMGDYRPALKIADDIISLKIIKSYLIDLHREIRTMLTTLKPYYVDCMYYKYFRQLEHTYSETFDPTNRNYFRRQQRLVSEVESKLVVVGFDDEWFTSNRNDPFIGATIDKVIWIEKSQHKNTKKKKGERYEKIFRRHI